MLSQSRKEIKIQDLKKNHIVQQPLKEILEKQDTK